MMLRDASLAFLCMGYAWRMLFFLRLGMDACTCECECAGPAAFPADGPDADADALVVARRVERCRRDDEEEDSRLRGEGL